MTIKYLSFFCCLSLFCANAQVLPGTAGQKKPARVEVSGYIVNEENKAVPYAAIVFRDPDTGESSGTMADGEEGFFSLEILPGTYIIEVSSTGYFTSTKEIGILEKTRLPPFVLKEKAEVLDEVVVRHEIQRKIKHNATGMVVSPQNDSLFKKISTTDILELLPGVSISENGNISLNGVPAMVTIDGKPRRLTGDLLKTFLESISGDQLKTIELINNPSAKYSGHVKKVIDITLKRERDDGISGTVSTRVNNANLGVSPGIGLDYKRGKLTFSFFSMPYSIFRRKRETYTFRHDSEQQLSFRETGAEHSESDRFSYQLGTDYTIDEKNSILLNIHWEQRNAERDVDFKSEQSLYGQPEKTYTDKNFFRSGNSAYGIDLGYRYDIEKNKTRLDIAGSYGREQTDDNDRYTGETTEPGQDSGTRNTSRNERNEEHFYVSARTDYSTKFGDLDQYNYEMGVKFDHVFLHNMNTFEHFDPAMQLFETDPALSTDFDYRENTYAGYASISSSGGRLKYSAGIRLEHTRTSSHVKTEQQQQVNSFFNIMPVASVKYMTNKRQTSNINLSYRKGYSLPPYMQLNPFENYVNSNTLRRGNPDLEQSIFHLISLGATLKNRYFLTWSSNYYTDVIEVAETMEDETNIISYTNIGNRWIHRANFNSNINLRPWWRINMSSDLSFVKVSGKRVNTQFSTFSLGANNNLILRNDLIIRLKTSLNNGDSSSYGVPNDFIRVYASASVTKKFLSDQLQVIAQVHDIFGTGNRKENSYTIGSTTYTNRNTIQRPSVSLNISYRFASGSKISKKNKKASHVDGSRF